MTKETIIADRQFLESTCIALHIEERDFETAVQEFFTVKNILQEKWHNYSDCKRNFFYWLTKFWLPKRDQKKAEQKNDPTVYHSQVTPTVIKEVTEPEKLNEETIPIWPEEIQKDILLMATSPNFYPRFHVKKLDYLIKKGEVSFTPEQRLEYDRKAEGDFIKILQLNMEERSNKALLAWHKQHGSFLNDKTRMDIINKIKTIAKGLAYSGYLKSKCQVENNQR